MLQYSRLQYRSCY